MKLSHIILIIIIFILLTGCSNKPFKGSEFNNYIVAHVEINNNIGYMKNGNKIMGLTTFKNGICKFKLPTLRWLTDIERFCVWGHELAHCILGTFHTDEEANTCY